MSSSVLYPTDFSRLIGQGPGSEGLPATKRAEYSRHEVEALLIYPATAAYNDVAGFLPRPRTNPWSLGPSDLLEIYVSF